MASSDPCVVTAIVWNGTGCSSPGSTECLEQRRAPTLWVSGGEADRATARTPDTFDSADNRVPLIWADHATAGHTGMWDDRVTGINLVSCCPGGPAYASGYAPTYFQNEPLLPDLAVDEHGSRVRRAGAGLLPGQAVHPVRA